MEPISFLEVLGIRQYVRLRKESKKKNDSIESNKSHTYWRNQNVLTSENIITTT
jgi:hypothetical protein